MREREEAWHVVESQAEQNPLYGDFSDEVQASAAQTSLLYSAVADDQDQDADFDAAAQAGINGAPKEVMLAV